MDKPPRRDAILSKDALPKCSECDGWVLAKGLCRKHYRRSRGETSSSRERGSPIPECSVDGCENPAVAARGYCKGHYARARKGTPMGPPLRRWRYEKGELVADPDGYVKIKVAGTWTQEHRHVMEQSLGRPLSARETVHHKNGDRADNRPDNLELWAKPHGAGQRVEDIVQWVITEYPEYVEAALAGQTQLRLAS